MAQPTNRYRVALVGTGHRGAGMWGKELLDGWSDTVDLVGLCDNNPLRLKAAQKEIGTEAPLFDDFEKMIAEIKPQKLIICTPDFNHHEFIIKGLEAGIDVITEKPMTTSVEKARAILAAERRTGRKVNVTFNYRFAPTAAQIKKLLLEHAIGKITSIDFHWYLDTTHGADYFRRWHAYQRNSGSLFVHKSTHHFDLLNWYIGAKPVSIYAQGDLRVYGHNGPFRGNRCKGCAHFEKCDFALDITKNEWLEKLYDGPSDADGYFRDACVYREDIDIYDTMNASIRYENGVQVSYSLNAAMPVEGYHLAFNGTQGRIEIRQFERQPWPSPDFDEILLVRNFKGLERISVAHAPGGHFGGDHLMRNMLLRDGENDPLGQKAGAVAGALSLLCGVAAVKSVKEQKPIPVLDLLDPDDDQ